MICVKKRYVQNHKWGSAIGSASPDAMGEGTTCDKTQWPSLLVCI